MIKSKNVLSNYVSMQLLLFCDCTMYELQERLVDAFYCHLDTHQPSAVHSMMS